MMPYILKFTGCLLVLYSFYRLFLESEKNHMFKRFYLLFALLASIIIPLITITYQVEAEAMQQTGILMPETITNAKEVKTTSWKDQLPAILWTIYSIGFAVFAMRFLKNLQHLKKLIEQYEKVKEHRNTKVLLPFKQVPYSYLRYIFVDKEAFRNNQIPKEILKHEEAHVNQKHTLDLLILEVLQIIFWFNPLFIFIKKSIRLNHEFLADEAVLNQNISALSYSNLLLNSSFGAHQAAMTSSFKNSLIKKRIVMISNSFSKKRVGLKLGILLPVLCCCIYFFNNAIVAENMQQEPPIVTEVLEAFSLKIHGEKIELNGEQVSLKKFASKLDKITDQYSDEDLLKNNVRLDFKNVPDDFKKKVGQEYLKTHYYQLMKKNSRNSSLFTSGLPAPPPPPMQFKNKEKKPVAPPVPQKAPNTDSIVEVIEDVPEPPKPMIIEVVEAVPSPPATPKHPEVIEVVEEVPEPRKENKIIEEVEEEIEKAEKLEVYNSTQQKSVKELLKDYNTQLKKVKSLLPQGYPEVYQTLEKKDQEIINKNLSKLYTIYTQLSEKGVQDKVELLPPPPPAAINKSFYLIGIKIYLKKDSCKNYPFVFG